MLWIIESMWFVDVSDEDSLLLVCCRCERHRAWDSPPVPWKQECFGH